MEHTFEVPEPVELYVELGKGDLTITTTDDLRATVRVTGEAAEEVAVEHTDGRISVVAPRAKLGFLGGSEPAIGLDVTVPAGSGLVTRTGSADQTARGRYGAARLKAGSGDIRVDHVTGHAVVDTGSGDITIEHVERDLRAKSGSGDVEVTRVGGSTGISTGSGDVTLGSTEEAAVLKSGSGNLAVASAGADLNLSTASGDVHVGSLRRGGVNAKNVSGDVRIGVPSGVPVWTDVTTVTGRIGSDLHGAGQPHEGEEHLEIRARSVSGDIVLEQL